MKLRLSGILFLCGILFFSVSAFADLEILGSYSFDTVNPSDLNQLNHADITSSYPGPALETALGADARFVFPVFKLEIGGRYEAWTGSQSALGITQTVTSNRGSVLVGYRLFDLGVYLGIIGTYGVSHSMKVTTTGFQDMTPASAASYSGGVEAGLKVKGFMIGGEAGYLSMIGNNLQQNGASVPFGGTGGQAKLDLSGIYAKIVAGFSL